MVTSAAAVAEASELVLIDNGIGFVTDAGAIKGSHACGLKRAVTIALCEDGSTLANVDQGDGVAGKVTDVVLTFLLAVARENLVVVNELASTVVALDLVGRREDDRGSSRGGHREGASAVGHIGEDSIILLEDDGGESLSGNLQEEGGEDEKGSEGLLVGPDMSALKAGSSVENKRG